MTEPELDPPPTPPERPLDEMCCGRGCPHCVFDVYEAALARYEAALKAWHARQSNRP